MATELRLAGENDLAAIHALVERAYRGDAARLGWSHEADLLGGQRTDRETLVEVLRDPRQSILLATDGGAITGCVTIESRGGGLAYLGMLAIEPTLQSAGLGRLLIAAAEAHARRMFDATTIEMTVIAQRRALIAYYERRGYRLTGERRPFPYGDPRFGIPRRQDLAFVVLAKALDELGDPGG